jgi:superfamily II DNA or RNA helicase
MPRASHLSLVPSSTAADLLHECSPAEYTILELLAVHGEPLGKTRTMEYLRHMGVRDGNGRVWTNVSIGETFSRLRERNLVIAPEGSGFVCAPHVQAHMLHAALESGSVDALCMAIEEVDPVRRPYGGYLSMRSAAHALARLRMAMLRGLPPTALLPWLEACFAFAASYEMHPFAQALRPFDTGLFAYLHAETQAQTMLHLLMNAADTPQEAPAVRAQAQAMVASGAADDSQLAVGLAHHWLLCGHLDEAEELAGDISFQVRAAVSFLRGDMDAATQAFDAALKQLRKDTGKRNVALPGLGGVLHLLALLRSPDPKAGKQADTLLEAARRMLRAADFDVWRQLYALRQVLAGTMKPEEAHAFFDTSRWPLARLFRALACYWIGLPAGREQIADLQDLVAESEAAGFEWIAAQAAELLHRHDDAAGGGGWSERAAEWRARHGFTDACDWFAPQETWQRQLDALIALCHAPAAAPAAAEGQVRLAWLIAFEPKWNMIVVEPREQKRDAKGLWTRGRPVALKRLRDEAASIAYLTEQDRNATAAIRAQSNYYGASTYEVDGNKAALALIGHPHLYLRDVPDAKLELVRGEPELLVREDGSRLTLALQPPVDAQSGAVRIVQETPTRLRVYAITDEHRRIAAILGRELKVPAHGREQVLRAVGALASSVTVQSAIGGAAEAGAEKVDAERRLFAHLLPHADGLKMQLVVQPFGDAGPAYAPGQGAANVIAEVGGRRLQAQRDLESESKSARNLIDACPVLRDAEEAHGEWLLPEAEHGLELLLQLQDQAQNGVVVAWPQGEKFRVAGQAGFAQLRLTVKSERDWFAAAGSLQIDEGTVLDLSRLLELESNSNGRFIALDDKRFIALTEEFHRRLAELAALADVGPHGARVHALAASSLEDLAQQAGEFKADKKWQEHLARLAKLDAYEPQLPVTLQAELRDYQHEGFRWLARLAHWGVGACLADDMGLGKTVQTLALLLLRAPDGPALVVAPTSVCPNWMAEIARFAPTLNARLFGQGDRADMLAAAQAFDVVIVSYGLLQQEAELFAALPWHTVVLDEAQAIKNTATKRSQAVMALQGGFRVAVTGTPLENHLGELWNLFRFLNPDLLGSLEQFNRRFAGPIEKDRGKAAHDARRRLRRLIQPFMLRRTKTQVLAELPMRTESVRDVELSKDEAALYESLRRGALERLAQSEASPGQQALQILAEIMKLRRACCHPQLVAPELKLSGSKLAAFGELVEELLANRHKALVFSQFVDHLTILRGWLDERGIRYQYLDGATPMAERKKRVDAFQSGDGDIFLISLKAGGTGLNLTAADYVIHMDPWWNPAVEDQASDRAHRMGQLRPVTIYRLVARGTIEEQIVDLHRHKRDLADSLLAGGEAAAKMSAQQMLELLRQG